MSEKFITVLKETMPQISYQKRNIDPTIFKTFENSTLSKISVRNRIQNKIDELKNMTIDARHEQIKGFETTIAAINFDKTTSSVEKEII